MSFHLSNLITKCKISLLLLAAVTSFSSNVSATEYEHSMAFDPPANCLHPYSIGNIGIWGAAGYAKTFYFKYNSVSQRFYMDVLFQACRPGADPNFPGAENLLIYPETFSLAINDGPNPNGIPNELAMIYFDADSNPTNPVITIYGYNGGSPHQTYRDGNFSQSGLQSPDRIFSNHPLAGEDTSRIKALQYIKDEVAETARFILEIDMTEVNSYFSNPEWTGLHFNNSIGYWFHPGTTHIEYPGLPQYSIEYCTATDTEWPCAELLAVTQDSSEVNTRAAQGSVKTYPGYLKKRSVFNGWYDSNDLPANEVPWCQTVYSTTHTIGTNSRGKQCFELALGETISATIIGTDGDGDDLIVLHSGAPATAIVTPASGSVIPSPANVDFEFTAGLADRGAEYRFEASFSDGYCASSAVCPIDICVADNRKPDCDLQITADSPNQCAGAETKVRVTANGSSDPDGDALSYAFATSCESGVITETSPGVAEVVLTGPGQGTAANCTATVVVSDGYQSSSCSVDIAIDACELDCLGQPNGNAVVDQCGVCNGTNACLDCAGQPNGNAVVDSCGICNGTNECLDCLGVPNGNAELDRCGVCDGDGFSCIQCESLDITSLLFQIDGTTLEQLHLGRVITGRLRKKGADQAVLDQAAEVVAELEEIHTDSWTKTWSLDLVQSSCDAGAEAFCIQSDNTSVKTDLVNNSSKAKKRIRRLLNIYKETVGRKLRKYQKRNNLLHKKTLELEVQLPSSNSIC